MDKKYVMERAQRTDARTDKDELEARRSSGDPPGKCRDFRRQDLMQLNMTECYQNYHKNKRSSKPASAADAFMYASFSSLLFCNDGWLTWFGG